MSLATRWPCLCFGVIVNQKVLDFLMTIHVEIFCKEIFPRATFLAVVDIPTKSFLMHMRHFH